MLVRLFDRKINGLIILTRLEKIQNYFTRAKTPPGFDRRLEYAAESPDCRII
jgi:hypothetical protein